ncbi:hypothetical protein M0R45_016712 [Rubus argutus]|uniref:Pre-mRNA-splicing factor Syf1-like N-terminal HAT-repeats domain-containing protein n=1 Tax=Rubus argutus TaxID=59490 RepID=A0AAW1XVV1_RUBAR
MKDLGSLSYFLGLEITRVKRGIFLNQTKYASDLLVKSGMDTLKACSSPCLPHYHMTKDQGTPLKDPTPYRSIVGALQYLTFSRPDIAYAVNTVCQFMTSPTDVHYAAVKRILRYLQGSLQKGLFFSSNGALPNSVYVKAFCDADWAGEVIQRRSTTGFIVYLGACPVSWQSKKQGTVSRSSTEAEYRSLANTTAEISWIRHLLCDLQVRIPYAPLLKCDNMSALALASNPVFHSRIKHLDNDFHFVRERVQHNDLKLEYVSTKEQTTDILTKGLPSPLFQSHCTNLRLSGAKNLSKQGVYKLALDQRPTDEGLYDKFVSFEKRHGDREIVENVIVGKTRFQYEDEVRNNPLNYDSWFDYISLEESAGNKDKIREIYERAIGNVPPALEKRYWKRYIYLWINYALYEELEAGDMERAREVYGQCLKLIPHRKFSFSKIWLLAAQFEIRQLNLKGAR